MPLPLSDTVNTAFSPSFVRLMSMRLVEGMEIPRYQALAGTPLPATTLEDLQRLGLVRLQGDRLAATAKGRPVLNAILRELAA